MTCYVHTVTDDERFDALLQEFGTPKARSANPEYADVDVEIAPEIAAKIWLKHRLTNDDVIDVVTGMPPAVVERPHPDDDEKRQFHGYTRYGWETFVVGVWAPVVAGRRRLRIITAFCPDEETYFDRQQMKVRR